MCIYCGWNNNKRNKNYVANSSLNWDDHFSKLSLVMTKIIQTKEEWFYEVNKNLLFWNMVDLKVS